MRIASFLIAGAIAAWLIYLALLTEVPLPAATPVDSRAEMDFRQHVPVEEPIEAAAEFRPEVAVEAEVMPEAETVVETETEAEAETSQKGGRGAVRAVGDIHPALRFHRVDVPETGTDTEPETETETETETAVAQETMVEPEVIVEPTPLIPDPVEEEVVEDEPIAEKLEDEKPVDIRQELARVTPGVPPAPKTTSSPKRDTLLENFENLLSEIEPARTPEKPDAPSTSPGPNAADSLVGDLEAILAETTPSERTEKTDGAGGDARPAPIHERLEDELAKIHPAGVTASSPEEHAEIAAWQKTQDAYRPLARGQARKQLEAVFRLEPQDSRRFREVCRQYSMDVLLTYPPRGSYAIIPRAGEFYARKEHVAGVGPGLREKYGLSIRGLDLDWLRAYRERFIATHLVPSDLVETSVLLPHAAAERVLGKIAADCKARGVELDAVRECHGTFKRRALGGTEVFEYALTKIILRSGDLIETQATTPRS